SWWLWPRLGASSLAFNPAGPAFRGAAGIALPKAVKYAIDRTALLQQGGSLAGKRADQILPPGIAGFRDASLYPLKGPDIATAKKWLAQAGVEDGQDTVVFNSNPRAAPPPAQTL